MGIMGSQGKHATKYRFQWGTKFLWGIQCQIISVKFELGRFLYNPILLMHVCAIVFLGILLFCLLFQF